MRQADAAERLAAPGAVVLLDGAVGIGRRTAATMLLQHLDAGAGRFEELAVTEEDDDLDASPDDRFLLDLSGLADAEYSVAQRNLAQYRSAVEKCGARLVVVLPTGLDHLLDTDLTPLVVRLGRPAGAWVFARHLRTMGVAFSPEQFGDERLHTLFECSPMRELAWLARLVRRARDSRAYGTTFPAWLEEAITAVTDRAGAVARKTAAHRDAHQRALLLSAAMFNGATADAVLQGAYLLLEVLDHDRDDTPRLAQADLGEHLDTLEIRRDVSGRVGFERLAYDGAVRTHFWTNFPDLRDGLREWVGKAVLLPELTAEDRMNLVARFAEQSLAANRPDDLCRLIETWTGPSVARRLRAEAAAALELGLTHDSHGGTFRSRIYGWATGPGLSPDLAGVLTDVCRQVLVATHPDQALVRLRHLALGTGGRHVPSARLALLDWARSDVSAYQKLVDHLVRRPTTASTALLRDLLEPGGLRITPPWPTLGLAWHAVMVAATPDDWTPLVHRWLTTVHEDLGWAPVLHVLLVAAATGADLLNRLYAITCDWVAADRIGAAGGRAPRAPTAERFCQKIDLAQGVDTGRGGVPDSGAHI
ncbi:hypothetical protein LVX13_04170 [Streptomyces albulus]|uniref:hypothetical protein n=1 Tax=Streptomyces noursei TaxID=1971 RepID=UPI001F3CFC64|nr:hypothetical protein [Streptomyces noursei]MCE4942329.1 hypothetical protein [Streptomyces noursei]